VIYSNWTAATSFTWADTAIFSQNYSRAIWNTSSLTASIISNGTILVYFNISGGPVYQMPFNLYFGNSGDFEVHQFQAVAGKLFLYYTYTIGGAFPSPPVSSPVGGNYRYIIIPGSVLGGRTRDPHTMSYQQVCQTYGIPE
jgi:hypothetical protein